MGFGDFLFDVRDGFSRVQVLGAGLGAVHDGVAAVELERVVELREPLLGELVARVLDPPVRLPPCTPHRTPVETSPRERKATWSAGWSTGAMSRQPHDALV